MIRRLVAVVGVAAMVALAGCASDISGTPTAGAAGGEEKNAADPSQEKGFDVCSMLKGEEVAEWVGTESMYVTSADVMGAEGRAASCQYFPKDVPGMQGMIVAYNLGVDPATYFEPIEKNFKNLLPLEIGDRAVAVSYSANGTTNHFYELRTVQGDRGIHMFYAFNEAGGDMPDVNSGGAGWQKMFNTAFERLPQDATFPDGEPEGACAEVDVDLAGEVLGGELTTARTIEGDNGALDCTFGGASGRLSITVLTEPSMVPGQSPKPADITHDDIGDGARVRINKGDGQGPLDARVIVGDVLVAIVGSYGDGVTGLTEPRPEDVELVRAIVDAVGGQD